ncbi:MAG: transposase [Chloroflexi bacterium]|nr:transposase [Chloroflexota bacterium]
MPVRRIPLMSGEYYHLYNRGNNHGDVFLERDNYLYFLKLWQKYLPASEVEVISYCLMPNHYHFLLYLKTDEFSKRIQPFLLAYTNAFNRKYNRIGALFQGRFKAKHISKNEYLLHLSRYIHLNPVRACIASSPEEWEFFSYQKFIGLRKGRLPNPDSMMSHFESSKDYKEFVEEDISVPENLNSLLFD